MMRLRCYFCRDEFELKDVYLEPITQEQAACLWAMVDKDEYFIGQFNGTVLTQACANCSVLPVYSRRSMQGLYDDVVALASLGLAKRFS